MELKSVLKVALPITQAMCDKLSKFTRTLKNYKKIEVFYFSIVYHSINSPP
jgi:hypothetical protein